MVLCWECNGVVVGAILVGRWWGIVTFDSQRYCLAWTFLGRFAVNDPNRMVPNRSLR